MCYRSRLPKGSCLPTRVRRYTRSHLQCRLALSRYTCSMMPQDDANRFGKALDRALKDAGKSQTELAAKLKVHHTLISRWVNGHKLPHPDHVPQIEAFLSTSLAHTLASPTPEHELFIAAPFGGFAHNAVAEHQAETAKVVAAARKIVKSVYWPSEEAKTAEDRKFIVSDIRTEQNLRVLNDCPALLYLQFAEVAGPSSAYIEIGYALGKRTNLVIMVKRGVALPYMLQRFGAVVSGLRFLPQVRIYTDEIGSADDAAALITQNGRKLFGLA